jgi:hypothetical protein
MLFRHLFEQVKPIYAFTWVSLCSFKALLAPYSIYHSPVLISLLLSTKSFNSCIYPPPSTYKQSNVSYGTSNLQSLMSYSFAATLLPSSKPTQMPIELAVPAIENLSVVSVFFLAPISFHGPSANNGQSSAPTMNQNITPFYHRQ